MSKELQALEDIILYLNANEPKGLYCKNIEIIKAALEEYETMKKTKFIVADAKISEEDLKKLINQRTLTNLQGEIKPLFDEGTQKNLKALEKIKNKGCSFMEIALIVSCDNYDEYCREMNSGRVYSSGYECEKALKTEFEFDLLKEVLK